MKKLSHTKIFNIPFYGIDFTGKASIKTLLQYLQELAWEHAQILDLGMDKLLEQNLIWVLARQKIQISNFPAWQDEVKVKTWATGTDRLFWHRDFMITNMDDKELARASSAWIIINIKTRRPHRADDSMILDIENQDYAFEEKLRKLPIVESVKKEYEKVINFSDLDLNDHVNNVKYIEWILDSYELEFLKAHSLKSVELNYISEAKYGDSVSTYSDKNGLDHLHTIKNKLKKELLRAAISWNSAK